MIDNFKTGDITIASTIPRTVKMFKNMEKDANHTCVKMLIDNELHSTGTLLHVRE